MGEGPLQIVDSRGDSSLTGRAGSETLALAFIGKDAWPAGLWWKQRPEGDAKGEERKEEEYARSHDP